MSRVKKRREVVSIAQLAKHLGLSEGTVSRALNNYPDIARKTIERVRKAADELGYRPSTTARRLARGVVETVGFVLPARDGHQIDPFLAEILDGLATELALSDWDLLVAAVPDGHDEVEVMDRLIRSGKVGGFVIARTKRKDPRVDFLRSANLPFVVQGRTENCDDYAWLDIDNEKAFADAMDHLVGMGHRKIAYLGGDPDLNYAWQRRAGYLAAARKHECPVLPGYLHDGITDEMAARDAVTELLKHPDRPTALLCVTDAVAIGAIHALAHAGITVGRDISVIGFDGLPMGEAIHPGLTTMAQASYEIGREVGRIVVSQANAPASEFSQILWEASLTIRGSANPPALKLAANAKGGIS
ncbi:substrate-binding domain-containing protein [Thalassospira australica]|uniref:substrate-binding domain-containing protein n=1 Tax=Thalassospira australica TaxID=1528106 RepID=UPI000A8CE043|nr:substrate-binding domain-containing protein [Thalassospira australica]